MKLETCQFCDLQFKKYLISISKTTVTGYWRVPKLNSAIPGSTAARAYLGMPHKLMCIIMQSHKVMLWRIYGRHWIHRDFSLLGSLALVFPITCLEQNTLCMVKFSLKCFENVVYWQILVFCGFYSFLKLVQIVCLT